VLTFTRPQSVVIDVWGGDSSQDHVARFVRPIDAALEIAARELAAGYLVNLRSDIAWGPDKDFDSRRTN
jgi:hypothetical protein